MMKPGLASRVAAALLGAMLLTAPAIGGALADVTVRHARGELTLRETPKTVFTLDLATLDTLAALGVPVAGVPGGVKPDYLARFNAPGVARIGTLFEPDYEAIAAGAPDLVIVGGRSAAKYAEVAQIAPTIDLTIDTKDYLASAKQNITTLGRIFGKEAEAAALIARIDASTAALKQKTAGAGTGLLILTTGGKMSTYGAGSRFGFLFDDYGVVPADGTIKVGNHGQPVTFEYILARNPDWLFVLDRDAAIGREGDAARRLLDNPVVADSTAWKKGQVVYLDAGSWYLAGGGATAMQRIIDQLDAALPAR